jgi:hypothetical protein
LKHDEEIAKIWEEIEFLKRNGSHNGEGANQDDLNELRELLKNL